MSKVKTKVPAPPADKRPSASWYPKYVGATLGRRREASGLKTSDVSKLAGGVIHDRMVGYYERTTEPKLSTFLILCAALKIKPLDALPENVKRASNECDVDKLVEILCG